MNKLFKIKNKTGTWFCSHQHFSGRWLMTDSEDQSRSLYIESDLCEEIGAPDMTILNSKSVICLGDSTSLVWAPEAESILIHSDTESLSIEITIDNLYECEFSHLVQLFKALAIKYHE